MPLESSTSPPASASARRDARAGERTSGDAAPERVPGLRERSKAKRRALIQRTAMRLFAERGFEHTTLADIAEEAEVAVRTVTGYFPSKLDLGTSYFDEIAVRLGAAFPPAMATAAGTDLVDAVDRWLTEEEQVFDAELMELTNAMTAKNPDLLAVGNARIAAVTRGADEALVAEIGLPPEDPTVELCAAAVRAVIAAHFIAFTTHEPSTERHEAVIAYLRAIIDAAKRSA
jgi:AcrR family transcriptional regulator